MNHHPIKAFPLQQNSANNQNKRIPSPAEANQISKEQNKKNQNHMFIDNYANEENLQMRSSKSSGLLRKSEQITINPNSNNAKNRISEVRNSSTSNKNTQDTILNSLQNILNNQLQSGQSNNPGSSHKRTQSTQLTGNGMVQKMQKNNSVSGLTGSFSQQLQDQIVKQGQNGVQNKSINKQQSNEYNNIDNNNLKSLSSKNIYKPSSINQNRYTPISNQNKTGMKGYTSIQNRIETNDRLPKLESLIQQQQQQMQQLNQQPLSQSNVMANNSNLSANKSQQKDTLKQKLQSELFKDKESNNLANSLVSNKNVKQNQNFGSNGQPLSNSGLFSQGPKININLQIKNLNIIQQNGLRQNNQQPQTSDNTPNNYVPEDSPLYDDRDQNQGSNFNNRSNQKNTNQIINLQQNKGPTMRQNNSTPNIYQNSNQQNTNSKMINSNSSNALVNGYSGYQQNVGNNQNKATLQNNSESRQSSRRGRSDSREKNESFSQQQKNGKMPIDMMGKYANPFNKSTNNQNVQVKPQSQSIDAQRRNSKKLGNSQNEQKQNQLIRKNSSHQQLNQQQYQIINAINQNTNGFKQNNSQAPPVVKNLVSSYAVRSKPGALPDKPVKTNQDSYIITTNFCKNTQKYFFSVCDGHGVNGHFASQYVKKVLPVNIEFFMKQFCKEEFNNPPTAQPVEENFSAITQSLTSGFLKTASGLLDSGIDITFSGSTCVSVYVTAQRYWCANIGDSRAIVGRFDNSTNQWSNQPLSIDHKPDLQTEHDRIIASGGRVDPFKDMEGNPVGPARVWMKHENIPGLAMARSFGDYVASQVGVIPEPEVLYFDINPNDRFLAVASDGVWEFLSNEDIVQMVAPFYQKNDPEGACEKIIKESRAAWQREDEVIDDITIIIVFLNK